MFCSKVKNKVKSLLGQFDTFVDTHIEVALQITTAMKGLLTSPVADVITALIPGSLDNTIKDKMVTALTKAVEALNIAEQCKQYTDPNEKLKCFVQQLQLRDPSLQDALLLKLASLLTSQLDGQRLKQNLYDLYTQAKYTAGK
jgi:hypothetical protein